MDNSVLGDHNEVIFEDLSNFSFHNGNEKNEYHFHFQEQLGLLGPLARQI